MTLLEYFLGGTDYDKKESEMNIVDAWNQSQICLSVCVFVCFNSSETAIGTTIKLGTINHHPVMGVTRLYVMS